MKSTAPLHTTKTIRFGVLGTGRITRRLVADLQSTDGVEVTAIASRSLERARWYADQYGIATACDGYEALLNRDDVDAVYVALPPSLHLQWALATAAAGKLLLCEKPLAINREQVQQIVDACEAANVRWIDATGWMHHPRTDAFREWTDAERFGKIQHISASVSFYQPFQSGDHRLDASLGGGCLLDLGWYAFGAVRFFAERLPRRISAHQLVKQQTVQRVTAMLEFDDDLTATVSCAYDTSTRKWMEVAGTTASLVCDDFTRPWPDRPARCWIHEASGQVEQQAFEGSQERRMIARLCGDNDLQPWQQQAIETQAILDAAATSAANDSKWIDVE